MASEFTGALIDIVLLLLAAQLTGWLFQRFKQPAVIGELVAGILVGPSLLGFVQETELLTFLAELGAIFLLFLVGIETRLKNIVEVGTEALAVAFLGVILPFVSGYYFGVYMGFGFVANLFIGTAMVATSVGITARVLQELNVLSRSYSRIILGAAVIDDVLGLIVLAVVSGIAVAGAVQVMAISKLIILSLAFVGGAALLVPLMQRIPMDKIPFRTPLGFAVVFGVGMATLSAWIGLAPIVGAFFAGMLVAEIKEDHDIENPVHGISVLLTPIFFAVVGLQLDLAALTKPVILIAGSVLSILAILGKLVGGVGAIKRGIREATVVGMGIVPRGEVGLIVAAIGLSSGAVNDQEYALVLFVVVVTTLIAPLFLRPLIAWCEAEEKPLGEPGGQPDIPEAP